MHLVLTDTFTSKDLRLSEAKPEKCRFSSRNEMHLTEKSNFDLECLVDLT